MARVLESRGLTKLFNAENITVFLPISEGFFTFDAAYFGIGSNDVQKWNELFEYGSQPGRTTISMLPTKGKITSRFNQLPLYVNRFSTPDGLIITINGATILQADIITDNGVIHIVDRMIAPVGSGMTIAEYLESPQIKDMSFSAIIMAAIIVPTLTQKTNSSKSTYTSFSPNDSYLYPMPEYGKEPLFNNYTILREVYQAHLIEDEALFLPAGISAIPDRMALHGKIQFYVRDGKSKYFLIQSHDMTFHLDRVKVMQYF
ncbi:stabilin-2 [Biomphalaria glabrata]